MSSIASHLFEAPFSRLHPAQITVGFKEAEDKRQSRAAPSREERGKKRRDDAKRAMGTAMGKAMVLVKSKDAEHLPGWSGEK